MQKPARKQGRSTQTGIKECSFSLQLILFCIVRKIFRIKNFGRLFLIELIVTPLLTRGLLHTDTLKLFGDAKKVVDEILTAMRG
jgi:hypothetical protein